MKIPIQNFTYILILLISAICSHVNGQGAYSTSVQGPIIPSASAMSFGKYADTPVDPSSGTTSIDIPLYTLSDGPLAHPISISYHTGGLRVSEISSEIGLGWNLNAGGVVARTVRGLPDDHANGYWNKGSTLNNPYQNTEGQAVANGQLDAEPDLFFFNANGIAGKFMIDHNHNVYSIPKSDLKIEVNYIGASGFNGFRITSPDGTKYYFGFFSGGGPSAVQTTKVDGQDTYNETWFLTKIQSFDSKHSIDFLYATNNYKYQVNKECYLTRYYNNGQQTGTNTCNGGVMDVKINGKILSSITTSTATATFTTASRDDLLTHDSGTGRRITRIDFNNGPKCIYYNFAQTYFTDGSVSSNLDKRLKLDAVQKLSCTSGSSENEPPYNFTYNGSTFFPSLLSKAIDHWGYYNGQTYNDSGNNLIPATTVITTTGNHALGFGSANRTTVEAEMIKGMLQRITFPTKGYTEYTYEANTYLDAEASLQQLFATETCAQYGGSCCSNLSNTRNQVLDQAMINTGKLELLVQHDGSNVNCPGEYHSVQLSIYDDSNGGALVDGFGSNIFGTGQQTIYKDLNTIPGLVVGHNYRFVLTSVMARGELKVKYSPTLTNALAGGLRVKQIKTHDGLNAAIDILRTFEYKLSGSTQTSGIIVNKPKYGFLINYHTALFASTGVFPLTNMEGNHLTYSRVIEYRNGNGYIEYLMDTETYSPNEVPDYPAKPGVFLAKNGVLKEKNIFNQSGTNEASESIIGYQTSYTSIPGMKYAAVNVIQYNGSSTVSVYTFSQYTARTGIFRPQKITNKLDGVITETNYEYHSQNKILSPIKTFFTNSDGKLHETRIKYTVDYDLNTSLKNVLIGWHMIGIPFESSTYVNNVQVDGSRTEFSNYLTSGVKTSSTNATDFPRPYKNWRYEITWANGVIQTGAWQAKENFLQYSSAGLPYIYEKIGWTYVYYYYNVDKLLERQSFNGHETIYSYYTNSTLVQTVTNVDGTTSSYTYDGLMRLKTESDDCNSINTTYNYYFTPSIGLIKSYVETIEDYPAKPNSAVDVIKTKVYKDGLGRDIQIVRNQQSVNSKDLLISKAYDNQGRLKYDYQQLESPNSNAIYVDPLATWHKTEYEYYTSPLNRVSRSKPQGWYWTKYLYGANDSDDYIKINGTTINYGVNLLSKRTVIDNDGSGRKTIVFTDKKGRTIMSRQTNNAETTTKRLDTYSMYDDKDRVSFMLPPGAPSTSSTYADLYYQYEYDGEDHLILKKVPGAQVVYYKYDSRDLLGGYQDGYLRAQNKWYTYFYDTFGRELRQGFFNGTPTTSFDPSSPQIKTTYGTNSYDKDKVKTVETLILGTSTWLNSTNTYSTCGILTNQSGNNHVNTSAGSVTNAFAYDGAFNVTGTTTTINAFSINKTITTTQTYDHAERPKLSYFKIDSGVDRIISKLEYNGEDELITKYQGNTGLSGNLEYLQKIDYAYRDHGPLYLINSGSLFGTQQAMETCTEPNPTDPGADYTKKDLFYLQLYYNTTFSGTDATAEYNGNIVNAVWQVRGREEGIYSYKYDDYNRLTQARYYDRQNGTLTQSNRYTATYQYDTRGNLTNLTRNGMYDSGGCSSQGQIDNLTYSYFSNSNKLRQVSDAAPSASNAAGFKNTNTTNYQYDENGNLKNDQDRQITTTYNHLNLPTLISFTGTTKTIEFTYDAAGNLLTKKVKTGTTTDEQRDYVNGIEFVKTGAASTKIESIPHAEGRVYFVNGTTPRYEYIIQDHLGNTRLLYCDIDNDGQIETPEEILWEGHYYPFGLEMKGPWMDEPEQELHYKYNGIEKVGDHGLGLYMAAYRTLDPALGRWCSVDPKAEGAYGHSPYNSMWNNPVSFSDPEGDFAWIPFAIGAALGGFSGYSIGKANGATGWSMFGYIAGGAAIGGLSGAAGAGVTSSLGTSLSTQYGGLIATAAGGATGGALAGGGFAGLAGQNVFDGAWKGALSGFVGAGLGGYISGGAGAFVGGAASGGINAGLNGENVGLSALAGGALSFGSYQLTSAINYKKFTKAGGTLSRKQFNAFSRASQKSFTRGREFGGWLTTDGDVQWWNKGEGASVLPTPKPSNAFGEFHTHPNQGGSWIEWHSPGDIRGSNADGTFSYVIGRKNYYTYRPGASGPLLGGANSYFQPYPYNYYWWKFLSPMGTPPGN